MYYICESDKPKLWQELFNIIRLEGNKIILPICNVEKRNKKNNNEKKEMKEKQMELKLAQKTNKIINQTNSRKVVISKEIQKHKTYLNQLYTYDLDIIDGKWLFFMLIPEILEYVIKKQKIVKEQSNIHILVNQLNENIVKQIKELSKKYKNVYIVTKHIEKFKKIEEEILEDTGTVITVMNNKKKSLAKSKIIVNIDFPQELINQYVICEDAIILDCLDSLKITKKRFNGIIIHDYDIFLKNNIEYGITQDLHYQKDLYEAEFYKKQPYEQIREKIKKDGIQIVKLYGLNQIF